jgi:ribose/xylose/arabinose/galactoside ABC-type transport system permease subunit
MYVDRGRELSILAFLALILLVLAVAAPGFFSADNLLTALVNASYIAIAALGMTFVVLTGQPDISVGSILAICSTVAALASKADLPIPLVFALAMGVGAALGLVNGLLVNALKIHAIIVTLGTMGIFRGALIYVTQGAWIYDLPASFRNVSLGSFLGLPNPIWAMIITLLIGAWVLRQTAWGRALYAVGSNPEAARLSGIRVPWITLSAFALNGALVGLAAMFYASRFSTIQSNTGVGFEFLVITAVVVGGIHIFGGSGTVVGMALGALLVSITGTVLTFLHISAYWERTLHGLFILLAVGFGVLRERQRRQARRTKAEAP